MIRSVLLLLVLTWTTTAPTWAEVVVAARTIPGKTLIRESDLMLLPETAPDSFSEISELVGLETRVAIYKGRPIPRSAVGPAAVIERNQIVTLIYRHGGLLMTAEARALGRAGVGDTLRVMNIASRKTVSGTVSGDGSVIVGPPPPRRE